MRRRACVRLAAADGAGEPDAIYRETEHARDGFERRIGVSRVKKKEGSPVWSGHDRRAPSRPGI
ncbi:MAG TPA: hypothetical protein VLA89_17620 [Gemmatimonadales bacterium]|nr:hypothetical protein [Gemmatimonadales bacterium]